MSKRSRTLKKARRHAAPGRPVTKVRGASDTLALVPYLFGFVPVESLVVISLQRGGKQFGPMLRLDLPEPEDREMVADQMMVVLRRQQLTRAVVAVYSSEPEVADPFARLVLDRLRSQRVEVVDAFRGDGRRWWSYVCGDPWCCPAGGTEYDAGASPAALDAVLAGMTKAPDRDALRGQFAADPVARAVVAREVAVLRQEGVSPMRTDEIAALVPRVLDGAELSPREQAHLLLSLSLLPQRDEVWGAMRRDTAERHLERWRVLMRAAPDELLAPIGSLTAFAAWLSGRGVLASHAVDRVLGVRPDYSMALLVQRALETAVDPREWSSWTG